MNDQNRQQQSGQHQQGFGKQQQSGSDSSTMDRQQQFRNLDEQTARALLTEASIDRQRQSGSLSSQQEQDIRADRQGQSIGAEDAIYAFTNLETLMPKVEQSLGRQT
jgi:hypothetical protein